MEQTTDAEKAMAVFEFLDFKRKNKVCYICFLIASHLRLFFICYLIVLFLFCSFHLAANYLLSMNFSVGIRNLGSYHCAGYLFVCTRTLLLF